jgi:serine protease AprX
LCARPLYPAPLQQPELNRAALALLSANAPNWKPQDGLCESCAQRAGELPNELTAHSDLFVAGSCRILPTALRLGAARDLTGRGVTVAFLDAGFYAHPDLVEPTDRILHYTDVTRPHARRGELLQSGPSSWHGMMTSVTACGNGRLSGGFYRGLASESNLVLVKVGSAQRIVHDDIRRGLDWVARNRKRYGIRIVNISCGGDYPASYLEDDLSMAVERVTRAGVLVVAAAGNLGQSARPVVLPPASAPAALTVGGLDDRNRLAFESYEMYHSSFGPTLDALQKPEVIAPGIWVAAPILPGTPTADEVRLLVELSASPDHAVASILAARRGVLPQIDAVADAGARAEHRVATIRRAVESALAENNVITRDYKHVDGTSFAAPIVSSVAAQLLELDPALTPQQLKLLLVRTARRLPHVPVDRQGWGVVDPARAVLEARRGLEEKREGR